MKNLYLIDYENAHWCGGQLNVVVYAYDEQDAIMRADYHMDSEQRELFSDEYGESVAEGGDEEYADECAYSINSVELFDKNHQEWAFFKDPTQSEFYPIVGEPD
jgi:hypothetical protein